MLGTATRRSVPGSRQIGSVRAVTLMDRMGHSSPRAALIYQHATRERDEAIAAAMGEVFATAKRKGATQGPIGHAAGTKERKGFLMAMRHLGGTRVDLGFWVGAGEGNRTLMTSLEGWGSTIELRPRRERDSDKVLPGRHA